MPQLVVEKGNDKGRALAVPEKGTIFIGRDSSSTLQLRDTMTSRVHCKIEVKDDGSTWIHDLESRNGTLVNGKLVHETELKPGDLIKVGETLLTYMGEDPAATGLDGQRVGGYKVLERVGRGGMGTVYKAEQIDLQRIVALKVISEEHTKDKEFVELFIHEARSAARLNHPNVVQVYDVKRHNDAYYFSMEFMPGGTVQDVLNKQKKMPVRDAVRMVLQAARGLDYAHKKGIVHRDVKPDNLMLSEGGEVKIGDMGLARGLGEKIGPDEDTAVIGTPHYIAPEQVLGKDADFRSDLYSLGATAYRMLAGVTPYAAASVRDLVNKKVREDAAPLHELSPEVPRRLSDIVAKMMARDPGARYAGMPDLMADLEVFQREDGGTAAEPARPAAPATGSLFGNRRLVAAALIGLLAAGGGTVAFLLKKPQTIIKEVPTPGSREDRAAAMLELARLTELQKMNKSDPKSIELVIKDYQKVIENFPGTAHAAEATKCREELRKLLRDLNAERRLEIRDADDAANYRKMLESLPRQLDLEPVEKTFQAYQDFCRAGENQETPAAAKAAARADHVLKWKQAVEQRRTGFEKASARAEALVKEKQFKAAWVLLDSFQKETRDARMACDFAPDRYHSLLFDDRAETEAANVTTQARADWIGVERATRDAWRNYKYEEAIEALKPTIQHSLDEVVTKARGLKETLENDWAEFRRKEDEAKAQAKAAALRRAREVFERESGSARDLCLKYDFKGALERMKYLRDSNTVEELRPRLERRVLELERAARFKATLVGVISTKDVGGKNPHGFDREYKGLAIAGVIESADDKAFTVRVGSGTLKQEWSRDPAAFLQFVRTQWRGGKDQGRPPDDACDLAALCMEFGLYEEALEEIQALVNGSLYAGASDGARQFCEEYSGRLARAEFSDHEEIEAQKRMKRLDAFMNLQNWSSARSEVEILRKQFSKTRVWTEEQETIQKHLQRLNEERSEEDKRKTSEETWKGMQARVAEEQKAAKGALPDILARVNRFEDPLERNFALGRIHAGAAEWDKSTQRFHEVRIPLESQVAAAKGDRDSLHFLGYVYALLYRNYIVTKDRKSAEGLRKSGDSKFMALKIKAEEDWWTGIMTKWVVAWADETYPLHQRGIDRLKDKVRADPADPQKIWELACAWQEGLWNLFEARGYFAYLLEFHPDFDQVQNGNCLHRLAEIRFEAHEVREALDLYKELAQNHKDHPKVKTETDDDSVKHRSEACYRLMRKMGYSKEKE